MDKDDIREVIEFLANSLRESGVEPSKIVLFGSRDKGVAGEDSDIDLVVVSDAFRGKGIFERAGLTKQAEIQTIKRFMIPLDVVSLTPDEFDGGSSIIAEYAKHGEVVL